MQRFSHYDVIDNEWLGGKQRIVAKVYDRAAYPLKAEQDGSYRWSTGWHTDEDCAFREVEELPIMAATPTP